MQDYKILAHRGASAYAPENTMAAFELAVEQKADGFEIDIYFTKDKQLAVIHDPSIDRTSDGNGFVSQYTMEELKIFNFNKGFESKYPVARIPFLGEVLELVKKHDLILNIEVKDFTVDPKMSTGLSEAAAQLVKSHGLTENVIFSSFNHHLMVRLKDAYPEMKTGLLYFENLYRAEQYALSAKADALHPLFISVNAQMLEDAHTAGIQVNPYTIDDPLLMKLFRKYGVDSIITDCPDVCYNVRNLDMEELNLSDDMADAAIQDYLQKVTDYMSKE